MDDFSHALWSYVLFSKTPFALLAAVVSILPDVLPFIPSVLHNWSQGKFIGKLRVKQMPKFLQHYVHIVFGVTHSLIIAIIVSVIVLLVWPEQWWILVWPLHVLIDIFTHAKEEPTLFLWPLSEYGYGGWLWTWKHLAVSTALAGLVWLSMHVL